MRAKKSLEHQPIWSFPTWRTHHSQSNARNRHAPYLRIGDGAASGDVQLVEDHAGSRDRKCLVDVCWSFTTRCKYVKSIGSTKHVCMPWVSENELGSFILILAPKDCSDGVMLSFARCYDCWRFMTYGHRRTFCSRRSSR